MQKNETGYLLALPQELLFEICAYLDVKSNCRLAATCRALYRICDDNVLWRKYIWRDKKTNFVKDGPWVWKAVYYKRIYILQELCPYFLPVPRKKTVHWKPIKQAINYMKWDRNPGTMWTETMLALKHMQTKESRHQVYQAFLQDAKHFFYNVVEPQIAEAVKTNEAMARRTRAFNLWKEYNIRSSTLPF